MDEIIVQFLQHLRTRFASTGKTVDMAYWTQFAAFDIVMEMAFSSPFGFIHHGEDVNGIIASLHQLTKLAQVLGLIPIVMKIFLNPHIYPWVGPKPTDKSGPGAVIGVNFPFLLELKQLLTISDFRKSGQRSLRARKPQGPPRCAPNHDRVPGPERPGHS
jgi:hypothetical protein